MELGFDQCSKRLDQRLAVIEHGCALDTNTMGCSYFLNTNIDIVENLDMIGDKTYGCDEEVFMPFFSQASLSESFKSKAPWTSQTRASLHGGFSTKSARLGSVL